MTVDFKEAQSNRVNLYAKRYAEGKDIFTGKPLLSIEYEQRELTEQQKADAAIYGFGNKNGPSE